MKKLLFILLLISFSSKSQYNNLFIESRNIYFEKIYKLDSVSQENIKSNLISAIPKIKDITNIQEHSTFITAKLNRTHIDYKKYGGKFFSTAAFLNHPFFCDILVEWKDGRYRVTATNMFFNEDGLGKMNTSDLLLSENGEEINKKKLAIEAGKYIENYLSDLFKIKVSGKGW
ncbi:hypothetical protein [Flectobacillus sp. BAB-3569]|uniref:hypothetical protein n=1 Tax=Flectobacillus sp. BAB-3569 TaxID=1509483 RepID=UPI000BA3DF12|nr:hypothetical protein [Flectobacillus sp. BAB-3569]PAC29261.1 hypothetical protein BWI92_16665 [Flectobacillus sp. BAB-3569]